MKGQDESKKKKKNTDIKSKSIKRVKKAEETKEKTEADPRGSVVKKEQHESNVDKDSHETSKTKKKTIQDKQKNFENSPEPELPKQHSSPKKIGSIKSVDGTSDSNYARIELFAPCDKDTCVLKGAPKGCGIRAYEKLAASHTRFLKKVSDLAPLHDDGGDSNDSNADSNDESNATFSTVLKIVEYMDSETSPSKVPVTGTPEHAETEGILLSMHITNIVI